MALVVESGRALRLPSSMPAGRVCPGGSTLQDDGFVVWKQAGIAASAIELGAHFYVDPT